MKKRIRTFLVSLMWRFSLRRHLRNWLGIEATHNQIDWIYHKVEALHRELDNQIRMVGVDVMVKNEQSIVVIISRLGGGTVQIKPVYFQSVSEMMDFIRHTERTLGNPDRLIIDAPWGMGRLIVIDEERKRRR